MDDLLPKDGPCTITALQESCSLNVQSHSISLPVPTKPDPESQLRAEEPCMIPLASGVKRTYSKAFKKPALQKTSSYLINKSRWFVPADELPTKVHYCNLSQDFADCIQEQEPADTCEVSVKVPSPTLTTALNFKDMSNENPMVNILNSTQNKSSDNSISKPSNNSLYQSSRLIPKPLPVVPRKCCAQNCFNTESSHTMYSFPGNSNLQRLKKWIEGTGNETLLRHHPRNLIHNFFLCQCHFDTNQINGKMTKLLKRNAVPTLFSHSPLTEEQMLIYFQKMDPYSENPSQTSENVLQNHTIISNKNIGSILTEISDLCDTTASESTINGKENNCNDKPTTNTRKATGTLKKIYYINRNQNACSISVESLPSLDNSLSTSIATNQENRSEQTQLIPHKPAGVFLQTVAKYTKGQCSVKNCSKTNLGRSNITLFNFPRLSVYPYEYNNIKRCKLWIQATGNETLLTINPFLLHQCVQVCDLHFFDEQFYQVGEKLLPTAVPSINLPDPIEDEKITWYYSLISEQGYHWHAAVNNVENVQIKMQFEEKMKLLAWSTCTVCNEAKTTFKQLCRPRNECIFFSSGNNMNPGQMPPELSDLTFVEEQLIARIHPLVVVYKLKYGAQCGYSGNVISFPQNKLEHAYELPHNVEHLKSIVVLKVQNTVVEYHDFRVRVSKVRSALKWLVMNNKYYKDIVVSKENLRKLPKDGNVYDKLMHSSYNDFKKNHRQEGKNSSLSYLYAGTTRESSCRCKEECNSEDDHAKIYYSGVPFMCIPHSDEQEQAISNWPSFDKTAGYLACAFPTLFPTGAADFREFRTKKPLAVNYFRHLLRYSDRRFAQHKTFKFFALHSLMYWSASCARKKLCTSLPRIKSITAETLEVLEIDKPYTMHKVMLKASKIIGTELFWKTCCNNLKEMVEQLNLPTIFLTLNFADHHLEDLHRSLSNEDPLLTEKDRRNFLRDNPDIVVQYFSEHIQTFVDVVLKEKFKVVDFWFRLEFQHWEKPQMHGLFWLQDAPDVSSLQVQHTSEDLKNEVIAYFDQIICAKNPNPSFQVPETLPCHVAYQSITNREENLAELVNTFQRCTPCSTSCCPESNRKEKQHMCCLNFPHDVSDRSKILVNDFGILEFVPSRNDPYVKNYNSYILQIWRSSMDIAAVLSKEALIAYLKKFLYNSEKASSGMEELAQIMQRASEEDNVIRLSVERDYSEQETFHLLLGLKLCSFGDREFVHINLSQTFYDLGKKSIKNSDGNMQDGLTNSIIEKYRARPPHCDVITLWEAASSYDMKTWEPEKKKKIVVLFPKFTCTSSSDLTENYCRQQILLHVPWRDMEKVKTLNSQSCFEMYHSCNLVNPPKMKLNEEVINFNVSDILIALNPLGKMGSLRCY